MLVFIGGEHSTCKHCLHNLYAIAPARAVRILFALKVTQVRIVVPFAGSGWLSRGCGLGEPHAYYNLLLTKIKTLVVYIVYLTAIVFFYLSVFCEVNLLGRVVMIAIIHFRRVKADSNVHRNLTSFSSL